MRDHAESPSAATTSRSSSASNPASTRIVALPSCTTNTDRAAFDDCTTLANMGPSTAGASFIHRYADDAQIPIRSATTRGISPVALTSAISRARSSAVCRLRMLASWHHALPLNTWASWIGYKESTATSSEIESHPDGLRHPQNAPPKTQLQQIVNLTLERFVRGMICATAA